MGCLREITQLKMKPARDVSEKLHRLEKEVSRGCVRETTDIKIKNKAKQQHPNTHKTNIKTRQHGMCKRNSPDKN